MDLKNTKPYILAKGLNKDFESLSATAPQRKILVPTEGIFQSYGRRWTHVLIPKLPDAEEIYDIFEFFGIIAEENMNTCHFWSIVAWFCKADPVHLKEAVVADGYDYVDIDFKGVRIPQNNWTSNFTGPTQLSLHLMACVYTALLGKVINSANVKYVSTRIDRMRGIINVDGVPSEWVTTGHCTNNFIRATHFMYSTPHIRAVLFNSFADNKCREKFLPLLTSHVMTLLNGSFMTSQILIIMEVIRRAEIVALFSDLRVELTKFSAWLKNLTDDEKKEIGYLRLKKGEDVTQMVSLREVPLCAYVAYGLAKHGTTTLDNYTAFQTLDEKKKVIGDKIVHWILDFENSTTAQTAYATSLGVSAEQQLQMIEDLKGKANRASGFTGVPLDE